MAQLVVAAAGAAIGFAIGGPAGAQAGFALGSVAGGILFAPKPDSPKPLDTKWSGVDYGTPIPWYIGSTRVAGIPIYLSDKEAVEVESEAGKGGSDVVTGYEYYADVLLLLADTESDALLDVFKEGRRIYTTRADASAESIQNSQNTDSWEEIRFYGGANTQDPDPDYEADVGVGLAPAYIGRTTVFIKRCRLDSSANLPPFSFVISTNATGGSGAYVYDYTGADQEWVATAETAQVISWGGGGAGSILGNGAAGTAAEGGAAGYLNTTVTGLTIGETYTVVVGGGGNLSNTGAYGGGGGGEQSGSSSGFYRRSGGGGGRSALRFATADLATAAGGGGAGVAVSASPGGPGGGSTGTNGSGSGFGSGGSQVAGGSGGTPTGSFQTAGTAGSAYAGGGGQAASGSADSANCAGGGGGGGRYGGGGGGGSNIDGGGGGGGSSYPPADSIAGSGQTPGGTDSAYYISFGRGGSIEQEGTPGRLVILANGVVPSDVDLADVVTALHQRAGDDTSVIDVSDLVGVSVHGVIAGQVQPIKQIIEQLALVYYFEMVESGGVMKYVRRNGASIATIPYGDLGVSPDNPLDDALLVDRGSDLERPSQVAFNYINRRGNKYEQGSEYSDRLTTESNGLETIQVGIAFTPNQAKARADSIVLDGAISRTRLEFSVGMEYAYLEPTDVVTVTARTGTTYRTRIAETSEQQNAILCKGVLDDQFALSGSGITADQYEDALEIDIPSDTEMILLDAAPFRDSEATSPGHLVAAIGSGFWPGASIRRSIDNADFNTQIAFVRESAIGGTTTTALSANPKLHQVNLYETLGVRVRGTLSSSTRAAMQQDRTINVLAVETSSGFWEVIRFRNATLTGTDGQYNLYTLSVLHRGRLGSESLIGLHSIGDRCVLVRTNTGIREVETEIPTIGLTRFYKGVTVGRSLTTAATQTFANTCVRLKPWAPAYVRVVRDGSNNATIYPYQRSRLLPRFGGTGGSVMPSSDLDSFEIDVYSDGTFTTIVRTLTGTAAGITYSAANQTSDGLTPGDLLNIRVYQLNGTVNRGYALEAEA